jgi:FkbM family methyltransferase
MMPMSFKGWVLQQIPLRYHVPLSYWHRFITRRLEKELRIVTQLFGTGHRSVDVGANNGVYTYALARLCSQVEAFEPLPGCAGKLRAFQARNVQVHEVALSSGNGRRDLFVPVVSGVMHTAHASFTKPTGSCQTVSVPLCRLDDYRFDDVCFIKIDVEGHELDVLRGARATIVQFRPVLLVEVEQRHLSFPMELVFQEALRLGYKGFFVARGRLLPLEAFSYSLHQEPFLGNVLSSHYVNNFIFVHETSTRLGLLVANSGNRTRS